MDSKIPPTEEGILPTYIHRNDEKQLQLIHRKRESPRWLRFANAVIVGATIYLILHIFANLCKPCHQSISQSEAEKVMLNSPSPAYIRNQSQLYTSGPHLAGKNITQATYTRDLWQSYGIETEIEEYEVLLNYPVSRRLALLDDDEVKYEAELREDAIPEDPTSLNPDAVPTFHGYSANGNVTGELVYANFGHINDFRLLEKHGVNVSGKVVIVRYGDTFRGLKVKAAQEYGAIGVIIYSDPHEDGDLKNATPYPNGPGRHPSAVQRGSVQFLSKCPGDPSTPGYASKPGVNRTDPHAYIPSIPSLPISYRDALPFLKSLNGGKLCGSKLGNNWAGSLDGVEYCVESSKKPIVNLINEVEFVYTPIYNVIGRIPGTSSQEVILGNHRDAWVYGAGDPSSGSAVLNSIAQAFGGLLSNKWKPHRTIILASWDAEEYGLVGSTEWVEDHARHLTKNTLAYLNVDVACVGDAFAIDTSPLLEDILVKGTKDVITNTGSTMYENWKNTSSRKAQVGVLGSGSDYTGFLQLLGIASSDMGFKPRTSIYQYHSNYDSFYWMDTFGDPGWFHHQQIAQLWGLTALRLATSQIVEFNATAYANRLKSYVGSLETILLDNAGEEFDNVKKDVNLKRLEKAIHSLSKYAQHLDAKADDLIRTPTKRKCYLNLFCMNRSRAAETERVNNAYLEFERGFIGKGLPGRPIYKHVIYAPGTWEGYAGFTFPSIREALMEKRWKEAKEQVKQISKLLTRAATKENTLEHKGCT